MIAFGFVCDDSKCKVFPLIRQGHSFVNVIGLTVSTNGAIKFERQRRRSSEVRMHALFTPRVVVTLLLLALACDDTAKFGNVV